MPPVQANPSPRTSLIPPLVLMGCKNLQQGFFSFTMPKATKAPPVATPFLKECLQLITKLIRRLISSGLQYPFSKHDEVTNLISTSKPVNFSSTKLRGMQPKRQKVLSESMCNSTMCESDATTPIVNSFLIAASKYEETDLMTAPALFCDLSPN